MPSKFNSSEFLAQLSLKSVGTFHFFNVKNFLLLHTFGCMLVLMLLHNVLD